MPQYGKRWVKTQKSLAYWVKKMEVKAELQAQKEFYDKNPLFQLKQKAFLALEKIDPLELTAIVAGAFVVHEIIFQLDEFVDALTQWRTSDNILAKVLAWGTPMGGGDIALSLLQYIFPEKFKEMFGEGGEGITPDTTTGAVLMWLAAFAISYFAIKHGGELLGVAKSFVGVAFG